LFSVGHDTLLLLICLVVHHCPVSAHPFFPFGVAGCGLTANFGIIQFQGPNYYSLQGTSRNLWKTERKIKAGYDLVGELA